MTKLRGIFEVVYPKRFFIEGYDARNWGDVLMATASIKVALEITPEAEIMLARALPYDLHDMRLIFESANINSDYSGKPSWNIFFKEKGPFDITYRARRARPSDVILFCNGYIFGDPWSTRWLKRLSKAFHRLRNRGVKIILMPQSFGPFERKERQKILRKIVGSVSLAFTRDGKSKEFLDALQPGTSHTYQSIDYTGLLNSNTAFWTANPNQKRLCIIPNIKIKEKYGDEAVSLYVDLLAELAGKAHTIHRLEIALIHHTDGKDVGLINQIKERLNFSVIEHRRNPLATRRFIGESGFVISSRFHGIMNALSQDVPVISLGWSHKYSEIMNYYGMDKYSVVGREFSDVPKMLDELVAERDGVCRRLGLVNGAVGPNHHDPIRSRVSAVVSK